MKDKNHYAIIMAGGVGSRFWPVSRTSMPKQFIDVLGTGRTLIQETYRRFKDIVPEENIFVLTNKAYIDLVQEQLAMADRSRIIGEPAMRNTAPSIAFACHKIQAVNPNAVMVIAPSDHLIQDTKEFSDNIKASLAFAAEQSVLVTLGIKPSRPDTGYGYIKFDDNNQESLFKPVRAFVEKPILEVAQEYLSSGDYLWNAGIFIWSTQTILNELVSHQPELNRRFELGLPYYNTEQETAFLESEYAGCESISIDYAILEKSDRVYVLPVDFGWSDLGTWASVYDLVQKDAQGNVIIPDTSKTLLYNSSNCMINIPEHRRLVVKGLDDFIIVESNNTLMICPKSSEQEVKQIVADAGQHFGKGYI